VATITGAEASGPEGSAGGHPGQARGGIDTAWRGSHATVPIPVAVRLSRAPHIDVRGADL